MANRRILTWPNSRLMKKSVPVESFDEDLHTLAGDLVDTLNVCMGAGLAAPQIGVHKRVVVIRCDSFGQENPDPYSRDEKFLILVNAEMQLSGEMISWKEACLSVPGFDGTVSRNSEASLKYQTLN